MSLIERIRRLFGRSDEPPAEPAKPTPKDPPLPDGDDSELRGPRSQVF